MTRDQFEAYERKVKEVLARCGCDEHWPNECCASCAAIVARYLRAAEEHKGKDVSAAGAEEE